MKDFNFEKYVGVPFDDKGETLAGANCWTLARLIYKEEFGINLPSFSNKYSLNDEAGIAELIAQYKEGWESVSEPQAGDLVLFRILGHESHVGVMIDSKRFVDIRENRDSVVDSIDAPTIRKRVVGFFRYSEQKSVVLNAVPHPLKTQRFTLDIPLGCNLRGIVDIIHNEYKVHEEYEPRMHIMLNGIVIPEEQWDVTFPKETDAVEYRVVPGKKALAFIAIVVIAIYAPQLAVAALQATAAAGVTIGATLGAAIYYGTMAAVQLLGNALISRISPVRPPSSPNDPGSTERQLMVTGGANRTNPYGSIPVVLGKVRMTPVLASNTYLTYESGRDSYLSMLLCWGYGPLEIDRTSFKIGDIPLVNYVDSQGNPTYVIETLDRKVVESETSFNQIYGNDIDQVQVNLDLTCDGNPESTVTPGPWLQTSSLQAGNYQAKVAIHFPQGLRRIVIKGDKAGATEPVSVGIRFEQSTNGTTWSALGYKTIRYNNKDAFTEVFSFKTSSPYIRIRRETGGNTEDNPVYRYYHQSTLLSVAYVSNRKPATDPVGTKIAKTAIRIKATDQLSGNMEGINGIVQTWCKTWNGTAWVMGVSNNPADLMRYVLEHPGNPRKITSDSQLDLPAIQAFHAYCSSKGFEYNSILASQRSILDVLRDICAAGRASPSLKDGKWTVIIDEAKAIVQHFTPHNSWGFEGSKALPRYPHGLRVNFFDEAKNYQEVETIVYDAGYGPTNADIFESINLPGVTKSSLVTDHAKWHFAQAKLRPEVYTLNTDIEYLVCNRGDRVKVMHDVPMWGLGSARVKNRISSTQFELDEDLPFVAEATYAIRVRGKSGASTTSNIVPKTTDGNYNEITLQTALTAAQMDNLDLVLFGEINKEAQDLTVISIEPAENKSARLTLVDYGVTDTYNIFTNYRNYTSATVFESQITQPAKLLLNSFGDSVPTITGFVSDESVMEQISAGVFQYNMNVGYYNPYQLPVGTTFVEAQYDVEDAVENVSSKYARSDFQTSNINIKDVTEGVTYKVRLRYISELGVVGKWSKYSTHTVLGKSNPPDSVQAVVVNADKASGNLTVLWDKNLEIDVDKYEIRRVNADWGTENSDLLYLGDATTAILPFNAGFTYYIKAVDFFGNYSLVATPVTYASAAVVSPANLRFSFSTIALTNVLCALRWDQVSTSEFNIAYYEFEYDGIVEKVQSTAFDVQSFWLGYKTFTVRAVDIHERRSLPAKIIVEKRVPAAVTNVRTQVIDNTVMLYWSLPAITTLPIDHIMIKRGPSWASPDLVIGQKKGEFTVSIENTGGNFIYWLAAVDTSGNESTPVSVTAVVAEPPDFIFYGEFISDLSGTLSNAVYNERKVTAPVNTSETWESHFTDRTWDTPQNQIDASYPYYSQPNLSPAYYEEIFDFGTTLASSRILVSYSGTTVVSPISTNCTISTSADGTTYTDYEGVTSIYGTNFRYVKVRINILASTDKGLYDLKALKISLDSKLITDAGRASLVSSDANGTVINFNKRFIDVQSLTLSASGSTSAVPVYNFKDNVGSGTYSLVSNVCTVTKTAHGLIAGQKVSLYIGTGAGIPGVYTITSATADTFKVSMVRSDTSGNCSIYPQSFTAYLFNSSGTRISGDISWSVRGY